MKISAYDGIFLFTEKLKQSLQMPSRIIEKNGALVDATAMLQFNLVLGDSIKIGEIILPITGILKSIPGKSAISTSIIPPVFIPFEYIEQTGLIQKEAGLNINIISKMLLQPKN